MASKPLGGWALVLGLLSWSLVLRRAGGTGTLLVTDTIPAAAVPWVVQLCPSGQLPEPPMLLSWSTGTPTPSSNPWWERTPTLPRIGAEFNTQLSEHLSDPGLFSPGVCSILQAPSEQLPAPWFYLRWFPKP